jgi:hypothetical protein
VRHDRIIDKADRIAGAAWADHQTAAAYVLAFSGDIAYSGKDSEYERALQFVGDLEAAIRSNRGPSVVVTAFIPGNHDCDFERETDTRRLALNHMAAEVPYLDPSGDLVRQFLAVQDSFFAFKAGQTGTPPLSSADRLFHVEDYEVNGFVLRLNLYNTAWISRKHERQGELLFPIHLLIEPKLAGKRPAHLTISMLHHSYNWLAAGNARDLRRIVESTSDIVLTGHEHESTAYTKDLFPSGSLQYFEGAVLQSSTENASAFNVLHVDTAVALSRIAVFSWKSGMYQTRADRDWEPFNHSEFLTGSLHVNKAEYDRYLQDRHGVYTSNGNSAENTYLFTRI